MSAAPNTPDFLVIAMDLTREEGREALDEWLDDASKAQAESFGARYAVGTSFQGATRACTYLTNTVADVARYIVYAIEGAQQVSGTEYVRFRLTGLRPEDARQVNQALEQHNAAVLAQADVAGHA